MAWYAGIDGVNRRITDQYIGIAGVRRQATKGFNGVSGVRRQFFGLLEGITKVDLVFDYCAGGEMIKDPVVENNYNAINMVNSYSYANQRGSVSVTRDSSTGAVTCDVMESTPGSCVAIRGELRVTFDNYRVVPLYDIANHYIAPISLSGQGIAASQADSSYTGTDAFLCAYGVTLFGTAIWSAGGVLEGPLTTVNTMTLPYIQVICGVVSGGGTAHGRLTLNDGIYIDGKKYNFNLITSFPS